MLAVSLAVNLLAATAGVVYVVRHAAPETPDYPALGVERFEALPGAALTLVGDSQVQNGRWSELLGEPAANRGIGGQTVADTASWISLPLSDPKVRQLVVWAGTNDVLEGIPPEETGKDLSTLLERVHEARPDVAVTVLTVPPMPAHPEVKATNAAITRAAGSVVDVGPLPLEPDGVHVTPAGYVKVANLLRPHVVG